MVPILINKDVFKPSYNDLKFMVWNRNYFCTNLINPLYFKKKKKKDQHSTKKKKKKIESEGQPLAPLKSDEYFTFTSHLDLSSHIQKFHSPTWLAAAILDRVGPDAVSSAPYL